MTEQALTTDVIEQSANEQPIEQSIEQGSDKWYSSLNEEYRNHPSIQKFTDTNGLAKSYLSLESLMGQEKIPVPKNAEDSNAWALYNKAFNVPETPDKYNIKIEGIENLEEDALTGYKALMHKHHLSNDVAQELLTEHINAIKEYENVKQQQQQIEMEEATSNLKKEWGLKYEENLKTALNYLEKLSVDKEEFDYFNSKIGNDAKFIKLLSKMGNSISEGSLGGFEGQAKGFTLTPSEAQAEFDRIMNDSTDAYWAGVRNKRNDMKYAKENNISYVSEDERKARVQYVQSLMAMISQ